MVGRPSTDRFLTVQLVLHCTLLTPRKRGRSTKEKAPSHANAHLFIFELQSCSPFVSPTNEDSFANGIRVRLNPVEIGRIPAIDTTQNICSSHIYSNDSANCTLLNVTNRRL